MSKVQRGLVLSVAVLIIGALPAVAADFYETQLRLGAEAYRTARLPEAIDHLRIANFGLMDRPALLLEGLARLALAQNAVGKPDDARKSIERFVVVERQYPSWASANVSEELKTSFGDLARKTLTPEAVSSVPALAPSVRSEESRLESMTPAQRKAYYEERAKTQPGNARWPYLLAQDAASAGDSRAALRWAQKAIDIDPAHVEARVLRISVYTARKDYSRAATELAAIPAQAWFDYPAVNADAFVIYSKANEFARADELFDRVPPELASRPDVAEAMSAFRMRESSRLEEQAMKELPDEPEVSSEQAPAVPEAAPVKGSEEPVEARISAPRGSFTSPTDPVAESLATARRLIEENRAADAQLVLRDALRRDPGVRELRLAMLEASCLAADWRTGMSQLLLIEPFRKGEEKYMFYGAVVYFESERLDEAKALMSTALPKLARNPYVDHYARLVAGE